MKKIIEYLKTWTYCHYFHNDYIKGDDPEDHKPFTIARFNIIILKIGAILHVGLLGLSYQGTLIKLYKGKKRM